ncbi:MAG: hypothetical protein ACPGWR_34015 [Ardenticatenaceae bacterium]
MQLEDRDQQGSRAQAALISALVDQHGYWHANLGNARLANRTKPFTYSANDRLTLVAQAAGAELVTQTLDLGSLPAAAPLLLEAPWQLYLPVVTTSVVSGLKD